jgi:hypothetical protein
MEQPKFCPHCGTATVGEMKFCTSCGKSVFPEAAANPLPALPKKKSPWGYILITVFFLWIGWHYLLAPAMELAQQYNVTYRISGTTRAASLTIQNANQSSEQRDVDVPWEISFKAHGGQFVYLSAQNKWDAGVVKCDILIDGKIVRTATADTAYGIATCSGKL